MRPSLIALCLVLISPHASAADTSEAACMRREAVALDDGISPADVVAGAVFQDCFADIMGRRCREASPGGELQCLAAARAEGVKVITPLVLKGRAAKRP